MIKNLLLALLFIMAINHTLAQKESGTDCIACHGDPSLKKEVGGKEVSVSINEESFKHSVHGSFSCQECHTNVKTYPHEPAPAHLSCSDCHPDEEKAYEEGLHAKEVREDHVQAATCINCHGDIHQILPSTDLNSKTYRLNLPQTCGDCHGVKFVMEQVGLSNEPFFSYQKSVHGKALKAGSLKAAVCTDCHRSHDIRSAKDPQSPIFKFNVPGTCGKCHSAVEAEYVQSIHGQAISRGNWQAPVCTDCHGIHLIKPHIDPTSSVAAQALARTTCAQCHEGVRISQEFGIAGSRVSTYLDSYHGLASELGSKVVANCASCHGVHNILPSSDTRSTINRANLATTCGKCHPGASQNFASARIHADISISKDLGSIISRWVRFSYVWLIAVLIGLMLIHNSLVWGKKVLPHLRSRDRTILRMTKNQRIHHHLLLSSFFVLVVTGFALKYPNSLFAAVLGSNETVRRTGHRIAAVILLGSGAFHLGYIILSRDGRRLIRDLFPVAGDISNLIKNMLYYAGLSISRPRLGRFGYAEKMEYWAVIWGTIIMGLTGLMVWFKVAVTKFLPAWAIDVALTIHFYEAILATLAIIVWHFYHVIFDPDVYPMNWSWIDGRVFEKWYEEEHPLDFERLMRKELHEEPENDRKGDQSSPGNPPPVDGDEKPPS